MEYRRYKHYKNKKEYFIIDECKIQENNKWVKAYRYKSIDDDNYYVRSQKEFKEKFEKL